jgi:hypothetical protein
MIYTSWKISKQLKVMKNLTEVLEKNLGAIYKVPLKCFKSKMFLTLLHVVEIFYTIYK